MIVYPKIAHYLSQCFLVHFRESGSGLFFIGHYLAYQVAGLKIRLTFCKGFYKYQQVFSYLECRPKILQALLAGDLELMIGFRA
jgi:hypothetical protein